ncbi:hypothetical protein, partial [Flectobacillus roseus]|uniref:hypothetical protein n=1 Tax=Flectobacillus roseus TaxID=502259 RepID=UPI0024B8054B
MKSTNSLFSFIPESNIGLFVGRDSELGALRKAILVDKKKLVAISGNNATGKTSLWNTFLKQNREVFDNKVEIIYSYHSRNDFPEISNKTELVIIEDLSFEFNDILKQRINDYISKYSTKQFIIVGAYQDKLSEFKPNEHIHLSSLESNESSILL